ncbi:MAG: AAA family ATPase [Candidatus Microsaccharimonas sp.]
MALQADAAELGTANNQNKHENLAEFRASGNKELLIRNNPLSLYPERLGDLLNRQFPTTRWVVDSLIPSEGMTILSAAPASFKTWVMLEIALVVVRGGKLFDHFQTSPTGVLLIDEESGERILNERFKQLGASGSPPIMYFSRQGYKVNADYIDSIISVCLKNNIGLVMCDSMVRLHSGDENSSRDMSEFADQLRRLADNGIAVLMAHHNRKAAAGASYNPSGDIRGSGDILASADCHIALNRQSGGDYITVYQTKNRYMREIAPFKLRFVEHNDRSEFQLMEVLQSKDEVRTQLKQAVYAQLKATPNPTKKGLLGKLQESGVAIKLGLLGTILDELVTENRVGTKDGMRNAVHYFVTENGSALKTQ